MGVNPFLYGYEDNIHLKYRAYWKQMLSFVVRGEPEWMKEERPQYWFTRGQRIAFAKLIQEAEDFKVVEMTEEVGKADQERMTDLDRGVCNFASGY